VLLTNLGLRSTDRRSLAARSQNGQPLRHRIGASFGTLANPSTAHSRDLPADFPESKVPIAGLSGTTWVPGTLPSGRLAQTRVEETTVTDALDALTGSVDRLHALVDGLDPDQLTASAYPTEWSVADVLSHLGSGAVILLRRLDDTLAGTPTPDDAAPAVWDTWNAKVPEAQAADALVADRALLDRVLGLTADERNRFEFAMGPMTFDLDGFIGLRLNEHALHLWDIEVAFDPTATVAAGSVASVVDNLQMFTRFTGTPTGTPGSVEVTTSDPQRSFVIVLGPDEVSISASDPVAEPDLELPAEALVRLVYGRLDPDHTQAVRGGADLDVLRGVFPGA